MRDGHPDRRIGVSPFVTEAVDDVFTSVADASGLEYIETMDGGLEGPTTGRLFVVGVGVECWKVQLEVLGSILL